MVFLTVGLDGIIRLVFFSLHTWPNTRRTTMELVPYTLFFSISQIKELSRFFRVVALDLKGFNDSDKPQWRKEYKPHIICDELLQFIKSLGSNSVSIIGHDIGAIIGWVRIAFKLFFVCSFFFVISHDMILHLGNILTFFSIRWLSYYMRVVLSMVFTSS